MHEGSAQRPHVVTELRVEESSSRLRFVGPGDRMIPHGLAAASLEEFSNRGIS
jgi:hypothetical protein